MSAVPPQMAGEVPPEMAEAFAVPLAALVKDLGESPEAWRGAVLSFELATRVLGALIETNPDPEDRESVGVGIGLFLFMAAFKVTDPLGLNP